MNIRDCLFYRSKKIMRNICFLVFILYLFTSTVTAQIVETDTTSQEEQLKGWPHVSYVYFHGGGGIAFSLYQSSDIISMFPENENWGISIFGFPFSWHINTGIRNIVQVEYRKGSTGHHGFNRNEFTGEGSNMYGMETVEKVEMDYKFEETIFKINPLFLMAKNNRIAYFIIIGKGTNKYLDESSDGFEGNSIIFGLELSAIARYGSMGFSMKYYNINYETITLESIPLDFIITPGAWDIQFQFYLSFGWGR